MMHESKPMCEWTISEVARMASMTGWMRDIEAGQVSDVLSIHRVAGKAGGGLRIKGPAKSSFACSRLPCRYSAMDILVRIITQFVDSLASRYRCHAPCIDNEPEPRTPPGQNNWHSTLT